MKTPPLISDYLLLTSNEKALVVQQRASDIEHYERLLLSEEPTQPVEQNNT